MTEASNFKCKRFEDKVAVVTASSDGIGFAIAKRLGLEGAKVVVSSRRQKNVDRAVKALQDKGIDVIGLTCHVGKAEDRKKLIEETLGKYGGVDVLVSNAGVNPTYGNMLETPDSAWNKIFDTNLKATFHLVQDFAPLIEKRGGGSVILVSSMGGYRPSGLLGAYSVSKTAMLGLTKALSFELAASNIRINGIAPGVIATRMAEALTSNDAVAEAVKTNSAMKRFGQPDECAGAVAFLASDDASYITGETVVIAGGEHARL